MTGLRTLKHSTVERLRLAAGQDAKILCEKEKLSEHEGVTLEYLESLGLTKSDLKRLERYGLAIRGYTRNTWLAGDKLPNGREVPPNRRFHGPGHRVRWILVVPTMTQEASDASQV